MSNIITQKEDCDVRPFRRLAYQFRVPVVRSARRKHNCVIAGDVRRRARNEVKTEEQGEESGALVAKHYEDKKMNAI